MKKEFTFTITRAYDDLDKLMERWFEQFTMKDDNEIREKYLYKINGFLFIQRVNIITTLTIEYHTRCEQYDRVVCTGWSKRDNCAMPMNHHERKLISNHSRLVLQELYDILDGNWYGLTREHLLQSIQSYRF